MTCRLKLCVILCVLLLSGCTSYDIEPLQIIKPTDSTLTCEGLKKEYEEVAAKVVEYRSHPGTYEQMKAKTVIYSTEQRSLVLNRLNNEMDCPEGFLPPIF